MVKRKSMDKYDIAGQFKDELHGLIDRHRLENNLRLLDVITILEMTKFELLVSAAMNDVEEDQDESYYGN